VPDDFTGAFLTIVFGAIRSPPKKEASAALKRANWLAI
jgi:hypothetical protein